MSTCIATENAVIRAPHHSGIQHTVPEGTVATSVQAYQTFTGQIVRDHEVEGFKGSWSLGAGWVHADARGND
jgi:hypothetical protein